MDKTKLQQEEQDFIKNLKMVALAEMLHKMCWVDELAFGNHCIRD
jgi:hypothetical protein